MVRQQPKVSDYDQFVAYCLEQYRQNESDPALQYFENRFYNRREDNQTGHLRQAFYAAQELFGRHPRLRLGIEQHLRDGALNVRTWPGLKAWRELLRLRAQIHLPEGGDLRTVYKILPRSLGGMVTTGGGASPSFKRVIPLVARFLAAPPHERRALRPIGADVFEDLAESVEAARRTRYVTTRILRDSNKSLALKEAYEFRCQVCGDRIETARACYYAEAHHLQPLGGRHRGPDSLPNMLVLCPWHHAEFDYFLLHVHPATLELDHRTRRLDAGEARLHLAKAHRLGRDFVEYNNVFWRKLSRADA
jgi:hypothetical protein